MYHFVIEGNPVPWCAHGGYGRNSYDKRFAEKEYCRLQLKRQYQNNKPIETAVIVSFIFCMKIPVSFSNKKRKLYLENKVHHISRPDCTNMQKLIEDTLKGIVIKDDSQIVSVSSQKRYDHFPRTLITVSPV